MTKSLLERLDTNLAELRVIDRPNFLHGVYKQLVESHRGRQTNGEYRRGVDAFDQLAYLQGQKAEFMFSFADALNNNGMSDHATRLLEQYDYGELQGAVSDDVSLHFNAGIQLSVGGYREGASCSASIVTVRGGDYEVFTRFGGLDLKAFGLPDQVLPGLSLNEALALGRAAASENFATFAGALRPYL